MTTRETPPSRLLHPLVLTALHFVMFSPLLQWPGCWHGRTSTTSRLSTTFYATTHTSGPTKCCVRGNQVVEFMRRTVKVEAWFYALLLFNSAALAVRLAFRVAGWVE